MRTDFLAKLLRAWGMGMHSKTVHPHSPCVVARVFLSAQTRATTPAVAYPLAHSACFLFPFSVFATLPYVSDYTAFRNKIPYFLSILHILPIFRIFSCLRRCFTDMNSMMSSLAGTERGGADGIPVRAAPYSALIVSRIIRPHSPQPQVRARHPSTRPLRLPPGARKARRGT